MEGGNMSITSASQNKEVKPMPRAMSTTRSIIMESGLGEGSSGKKKRGRPRKYSIPETVPLAAMRPIDMIMERDFRGGGGANRNRGRPRKYDSSGSMASDPYWKLPSDSQPRSGKQISISAAESFKSLVVAVDRGEDAWEMISSFSKNSPWDICVLSATGSLSVATICMPMSASNVKFEGCFEIVKLSGSFIYNEINGIRSRTGRTSVSFAGPDGVLIGGQVAGSLVAATPIQVVLGFGFFKQNADEPQKLKYHTEPSISSFPRASNTGAQPRSNTEEVAGAATIISRW